MKQKKIDLSLTIEKYYPYILSILAGVCYIILSPNIQDNIDIILKTVIIIVSILTGFLSTLLTLLLSLNINPIVKALMNNTHYKQLMKTYFGTAIGSGFIVIASTVLLFLRKTISVWSISFIHLLKLFWFIVTIYFFTTAFRVIFIIMKIVFFKYDKQTKIDKKDTMTTEEQLDYEKLKKRENF